MDTDDVNLEEDFDDGSDDGEPDFEYMNDSIAVPSQTADSRKFLPFALCGNLLLLLLHVLLLLL